MERSKNSDSGSCALAASYTITSPGRKDHLISYCPSQSIIRQANLIERVRAVAFLHMPSQILKVFNLPSPAQLANRHRLPCHKGTSLIKTNLAALDTGGKTSNHIPPSNSTCSKFSKKTGRTSNTKLTVTDFLPASNAIVTRSIGFSAEENRERARSDSISKVRWLWRGVEKESIIWISFSALNSDS